MTSAQVPTGETWLQGLGDNVVPAAAAVAQLLPSALPLTPGVSRSPRPTSTSLRGPPPGSPPCPPGPAPRSPSWSAPT